jgi:hypothetical protein
LGNPTWGSVAPPHQLCTARNLKLHAKIQTAFKATTAAICYACFFLDARIPLLFLTMNDYDCLRDYFSGEFLLSTFPYGMFQSTGRVHITSVA